MPFLRARRRVAAARANGLLRSIDVLADEEREDAQNNPDDESDRGRALERPDGGLVDEVQTALEDHDRRSEMMSPDPATREQAQRRPDRESVAREEARRLREAGAGPGDER
jgi:hypothetical protein